MPYNEAGNLATPFFHDPETEERFEIAVENISNSKQRLRRLATCDGMVFVETSFQENYSHFILNPVTHYLLRLPSPPPTWCDTHKCVFVFDPSINQYKLVVWNSFVYWCSPDFAEDGLVDPSERVKTLEEICSVWTLGTDSFWRRITLPGSGQRSMCSPLRVNRKIYWVSKNKLQDKRVLLAMDISTEEITEFELPCCQNPERLMRVMEVNGLLYFIYGAHSDLHCYIIWVSEDYKWKKLYQKTNRVDESCECRRDPGYTMIDEGNEYGKIELKAKDVCVYDGVYSAKIEHFNSLACLENVQPASNVE